MRDAGALARASARIAHARARSQLQQLAEESNSLVQVTDPSGLTLYMDGPEWLKARAAEMNLVEGARCSEAVNGTNGVGTALAADRPCRCSPSSTSATTTTNGCAPAPDTRPGLWPTRRGR